MGTAVGREFGDISACDPQSEKCDLFRAENIFLRRFSKETLTAVDSEFTDLFAIEIFDVNH